MPRVVDLCVDEYDEPPMDEEEWFAEQAALAAMHEQQPEPPVEEDTKPSAKKKPAKCKAEEEEEDEDDDESASSSAASASASSSTGKGEAPEKAKASSLSDEQKGILKHVMEGKSCYFSGRAGSGKSHLLRAIIERAPAGETFITGTTGIGAINIGGTTLHSFAGIGLGEEPVEVLKERVGRSRNASQNWAACSLLIIDEISMLHGTLLAKLNEIAKHIKGRPDLPFGGIQLVCTGDFFQLPPVTKRSGGGRAEHDYCFLHPVWQELFPDGSTFELSRIFRQSEEGLVGLLNDVRYGNVSDKSLRLLRELNREIKPPNGIEATHLFATNASVDSMNQRKLQELQGKEEHIFEAEDSGADPHLSNLRKNCIAEQRLRLRDGAQVMLLKNVNQAQGLVNGSKGVITGFTNVRLLSFIHPDPPLIQTALFSPTHPPTV